MEIKYLAVKGYTVEEKDVNE